ncbi:MAG: ABC transporter, permease protein 1 (cluster 1, maltose/g3p/polyamine/iron), partial [uncultured Rubrobacteraceae bacterium]
VLDQHGGDGQVHPLLRAAAARDTAPRRPPPQPEVPRAHILPGGVLRPLRPGRCRDRHPLALYPRPQRGAPQLLPGVHPGRAGQHTVDHGAAVGVGRARRPHRLVDHGVQLRHIPGRPAGHKPRALRGGQGRRREQLAEVPQHHHPGPAACALLRADGHHPRVGQRFRPGLPHHAGRPGQRDPHGDHVHSRDRLEAVPDGERGGDELRPGPRAGPRQRRELRVFAEQGGV